MKMRDIGNTKVKPVGGKPVKVAPRAGSAQRCCGSRGGCRFGGANEIAKNAKSGGKQKRETITVVVLDDEALNLNSTGRMVKQAAGKVGFEREKLNVLLAATVEEAMGHILNNEVSLIILDRKLEGGRWGKEVLEQLLEQAPGKVDCAVMCTGSPLRVEDCILDAIGRERVFGKLRDQPELRNLMEHVLGGGSVTRWRRPAKEELMAETPKEPVRRRRERPAWI
jgi:response regulator RpfG family c-di-GMP phosphodiesterase